MRPHYMHPCREISSPVHTSGDRNVSQRTLLLIIQTNLSRVVVVEPMQTRARERSLNLLIHARASIGRTERIVAEEGIPPESARDDGGGTRLP